MPEPKYVVDVRTLCEFTAKRGVLDLRFRRLFARWWKIELASQGHAPRRPPSGSPAPANGCVRGAG